MSLQHEQQQYKCGTLPQTYSEATSTAPIQPSLVGPKVNPGKELRLTPLSGRTLRTMDYQGLGIIPWIPLHKGEKNTFTMEAYGKLHLNPVGKFSRNNIKGSCDDVLSESTTPSRKV